MTHSIDNGKKGCKRCGWLLAGYDLCSNPDCKNSGSAYYSKRRKKRGGIKGIAGY